MITVQNQGPVVVGTESGEVALTNVGSWVFTDLQYVTGPGWTNFHTNQGLRDGAVILVDVSGRVQVTDGPDLVGMSILGFSLAISSIGVAMGIRWAMRKTLSAGGIAGNAVE